MDAARSNNLLTILLNFERVFIVKQVCIITFISTCSLHIKQWLQNTNSVNTADGITVFISISCYQNVRTCSHRSPPGGGSQKSYIYVYMCGGWVQTSHHNHAAITKGRQLDPARHSDVSIGLSVIVIRRTDVFAYLIIYVPICNTGSGWYVSCFWGEVCLPMSALYVILCDLFESLLGANSTIHQCRRDSFRIVCYNRLRNVEHVNIGDNMLIL